MPEGVENVFTLSAVRRRLTRSRACARTYWYEPVAARSGGVDCLRAIEGAYFAVPASPRSAYPDGLTFGPRAATGELSAGECPLPMGFPLETDDAMIFTEPTVLRSNAPNGNTARILRARHGRRPSGS
jgi:hypothetical protein